MDRSQGLINLRDAQNPSTTDVRWIVSFAAHVEVFAGAGLWNFISSLCLTHWIFMAFLVAMVIPVIAGLVYFLMRAGHDALSQDIEGQCGPVIYVNALFRHGNRNTDATPPKDPYRDPMYWPGGFGALTAEGVLEHYRLGKWMRTRYSHLLPDNFDGINDAIRIVSTDWNRTLMSAQAETFGMFPITRNTETWEGFTSYPVPIHALNPSEDALLEVTKTCKTYEALKQASIASEKYQRVMKKYRGMTLTIEKNSGAIIKNLDDYQDLYSNYFIEEGRGLKLPDWLREVYPSPMIEPTIISFEAPTWDDDMKRLRGGPFVKEVLGNFRGKLDGSNSLNVSMYSAHDTSLAAAMSAMGVFNEAPPPFAALLLIELRMPSSEPVVVVPAGSGLRNFILSLSPTHWILIAFLVAMIPVIAVLAYFLGAGHDALSQDIEDQCGRVIYMNAMFRHGSRNTDATPPKDPYSDPMYWPGGFGALTAEGVLQHYRLGKWMRNRYSHLLPDDPADINEAIRIVSTDWNRTLMSAQAEMFGMFPITRDTDMWEGLTSYPVPIHTITTSEDALLEVTKKCKRYEALTQASIASEKYQSVMNKYQNMTSWIEENSGACIRTLNDYQDLYNNYFIEEGRGLKLPDWLREVYPSPMIEPAIISFEAPTWDDNMKRLRGGPFVKEVFGNFWGKLNGSNLLNMSMYSAHDTTLAAAMNTMGVFNEAPPPFAAMLLIELRMPVNSSEPFVTIWYKNTTSEPFLLEMPGCGSCCPLQQMEQNLKPIIPDDWEKECEEIPPEHGGTL